MNYKLLSVSCSTPTLLEIPDSFLKLSIKNIPLTRLHHLASTWSQTPLTFGVDAITLDPLPLDFPHVLLIHYECQNVFLSSSVSTPNPDCSLKIFISDCPCCRQPLPAESVKDLDKIGSIFSFLSFVYKSIKVVLYADSALTQKQKIYLKGLLAAFKHLYQIHFPINKIGHLITSEEKLEAISGSQFGFVEQGHYLEPLVYYLQTTTAHSDLFKFVSAAFESLSIETSLPLDLKNSLNDLYMKSPSESFTLLSLQEAYILLSKDFFSRDITEKIFERLMNVCENSQFSLGNSHPQFLDSFIKLLKTYSSSDITIFKAAKFLKELFPSLAHENMPLLNKLVKTPMGKAAIRELFVHQEATHQDLPPIIRTGSTTSHHSLESFSGFSQQLY